MNNAYYLFIFLYCGFLGAMGFGDLEDGNLKVPSLAMTKDLVPKDNLSSSSIQIALETNDQLMNQEFKRRCKTNYAIATKKYCPACWNNRNDTWCWWLCEGCWEGIVTVCCWSCCLKNPKN